VVDGFTASFVPHIFTLENSIRARSDKLYTTRRAYYDINEVGPPVSMILTISQNVEVLQFFQLYKKVMKLGHF
jgi:hypothetical protein